MSGEKWKKVKLETNEKGKSIEGWKQDDFLICLNINKGKSVRSGKKDKEGDFWWMEVTRDEKYFGEAPNLKEAKKIVEEQVKKEKKQERSEKKKNGKKI